MTTASGSSNPNVSILLTKASDSTIKTDKYYNLSMGIGLSSIHQSQQSSRFISLEVEEILDFDN